MIAISFNSHASKMNTNKSIFDTLINEIVINSAHQGKTQYLHFRFHVKSFFYLETFLKKLADDKMLFNNKTQYLHVHVVD